MSFGAEIGKEIARLRFDSRPVGKAAKKSLQLDATLNRLPKPLSGGQRQRVAIARSSVA